MFGGNNKMKNRNRFNGEDCTVNSHLSEMIGIMAGLDNEISDKAKFHMKHPELLRNIIVKRAYT